MLVQENGLRLCAWDNERAVGADDVPPPVSGVLGWLGDSWVVLAGTQDGVLGCLLLSSPQTFIDMEGSGFSGDLESLRVSGYTPLSLGTGRV